SRRNFFDGRNAWTDRQHSATSTDQCLAAVPRCSTPFACYTRRKNLPCSLGIGVSQRISFRDSSRPAGITGEPIRDRQSRLERQAWASLHITRRAACRTDCHLRGPGYFFPGGVAWACTLFTE